MTDGAKQRDAKLSWRVRRRLRRLDEGHPLSCAETFKDCSELAQRYVVRHRNWYRARALLVRRLFRFSGFAVIVLSAALPVVAFLDFSDSRFVITLLSVSIAALTALRTFFQWDLQWRVLKRADWKLTSLLSQWEIAMYRLSLELESGSTDCVSRAAARTQTLLKQASQVVDEEAEQFFGAVQWPENRPPES